MLSVAMYIYICVVPALVGGCDGCGCGSSLPPLWVPVTLTKA